MVRGFTLVQPFCFHCYDRYEFRQCNIVVDSVLNDNVEKFQQQKIHIPPFYLWCAFHLFCRTGQPDHPFVMQISLFTKLSGQISQFLSKMYEFDGFLSENSFKKKPISFSKWFMNPAGQLRLFQNSLNSCANGRNIVGQQLPTFLGVTCCVSLHILFHIVFCCWELLRKVWNRSNFKLRAYGHSNS